MIDLGILMGKILARLQVQSDIASPSLERTIKGVDSPAGPRYGASDFQVRITGGEGREARKSRGWRWYKREFMRATEPSYQRWLIREALDELASLRISAKPKIDLQTFEGRLEVGRDTRPTSVVAFQYGYSESHVRMLRRMAAANDAMETLGVERLRYDGSLEARCRIAAEPGDTATVAALWGVSPRTVVRCRLETRTGVLV